MTSDYASTKQRLGILLMILLSCSGKKLKTIETVNTELKQVLTWLRLNKLSLNAGKTELIFFHSKKHSFEYDNISIKFNGQKLVHVDQIKYLGMYIDKYLSWYVY